MLRLLLRTVTAGALAATTMLSVPITAAAAAEVTLRVGNWLPGHHLINSGILQPWAEAVEAASDGEIRVEIMPAAVGKPTDYYDMVKNGVIDAGYSVLGYNAGRFPLSQIMDLPFMSPDPWSGSAAAWLTFQRFGLQEKEHEGVRMLGLFVVSEPWLSMRGEPIRTLADFEGKKIRVAGSAPGEIVQALGGVPVQLPATEAQQAMHSGIVDGIASALETVGFFNMAPAIGGATAIPGGLYNDTFWFGMNAAKWESLSPEHQAIVARHSGLAIALMSGRAWRNGDKVTHALFEEQGVTFHVLDEAQVGQIKTRLAHLTEEWKAAAGADGEAMLAYARSMVEVFDNRKKVNVQ